MQLIIGGMAQGKLSYVLEQYGPCSVTDGAQCSREEALSAEVLDQFHLFLRRMMQAQTDPIAVTDLLLEQNPSCIVICDEVGCGVVPIEPFERQWREAVGRCCCRLASKADRVIRVSCGIGQVLQSRGAG